MDVELIIDGVPVTAPAGESVLDAARRAGRDLPALCHHQALPGDRVLPSLPRRAAAGPAATGCS